MGKKLYTQDSSGIRFVSDRQPGEVRIPNYVYDLWLPLLGATYIGVYGMYCRLERQEDVKGTSNQKIAKVCRIGTSKLGEINKALEELGFIKTTKPNGAEKLKHFTTIITVCDPPKEVTPEIIAKYGNAETYEPLSTWLIEDTTKSQMGIRYSHSQIPNGNADNPKQECGDTQMGTPLLQPSPLQPLEVESNTNTIAPIGTDESRNPLEVAMSEFVETLDVDDFPVANAIEENPQPATNVSIPLPQSSAKAPLSDKPKRVNPAAPWHDALLKEFNLTPETVTSTGDGVYWKAANDLKRIAFPVEAIPDMHTWLKAKNWTNLSVMSFAKYGGEYLVAWNKIHNNSFGFSSNRPPPSSSPQTYASGARPFETKKAVS